MDLDFPEIIAPVAQPAPSKTAALAAIELLPVALARFGDWRPAAAALVKKYSDVVFDVGTTRGMAEATAARAEVRAPRYAAQNVSKASKSELAKVSKAIGAEEQAIIAALAATEKHIDDQITAEEARKAAAKAERERIEAERKAKHEAGIATIRGYVAQAAGKTSEQIEAGRIRVLAIVIGDEWEEYRQQAETALQETLDALQAMRDAAMASENAAAEAEAQRVKQARIAAEQAAEAKRLADAAAEIERRRREEDARIAAQQAELDRQRAELDALRSPPPPVAEPASPEPTKEAASLEPVQPGPPINQEGDLSPKERRLRDAAALARLAGGYDIEGRWMFNRINDIANLIDAARAN